eukprot:Sspe_Gene.43117::Locus_20973_Transcript_1_1_Confidence_1.000_Length_1637::g.43117::m.43117/K03035/PSMD12, RPN5; 26S proteasome regulatory subunit N5
MQDVDLGEVTDHDWKCANFKQEEDFTDRAIEVVKQWGSEHTDAFQKAGKIDEAVEHLLDMEKKCRLGGDAKNTLRIATEIIRMLIKVGDPSKLLHYVDLLIKRRAQIKSVQKAVVREARVAVDQAPNKESRVQLIQKLRDVCQGKLHVELEFAQLSVQLANIWEEEGRIKECCDLLQDVQVETITNMERVEKLKILLLQIRLNLDAGDYIRAAIMSRKTSSRAISKPDSRGIKLEYFKLMLRYYTHFNNYWYLAKCWQEIYVTITSEEFQKENSDHPMAKEQASSLSTILLYLLLSPAKAALNVDKEQSDAAAFSPWNKETDRLALIKKYSSEKLCDEIPQWKEIAILSLKEELIHWPEFEKKYGDIRQHPVFQEHPEYWEELHKRITEHNIKVISLHYKRVRLARLSQLVDLDVDETERFVCKLVVDKDIWARVDRLDGTVVFAKKKDASQVMADWKKGIDHVLAQITSVCHLSQKEQLVHGAS